MKLLKFVLLKEFRKDIKMRYSFEKYDPDIDWNDDLITAVENNYSDSDFESTESCTAVEMPDEYIFEYDYSDTDFDDDLITPVDNDYSDSDCDDDMSESTESFTAVGMPDEYIFDNDYIDSDFDDDLSKNTESFTAVEMSDHENKQERKYMYYNDDCKKISNRKRKRSQSPHRSTCSTKRRKKE